MDTTRKTDQRLSLDVQAPDEVADVLRAAAAAFNESASELEGAWQEKAPGVPWTKIARILERAAAQCDKVAPYPHIVRVKPAV